MPDILIQPFQNTKKEYYVEVPGSKSITNRALLLAALANGKSTLSGVLFSDDSRHFLQSLISPFSFSFTSSTQAVILPSAKVTVSRSPTVASDTARTTEPSSFWVMA